MITSKKLAHKIISPPFLIFYEKKIEGGQKLRIVIPKKNVKKATERNRIRRIIREGFRLGLTAIKNIDMVIIMQHRIEDTSNKRIKEIFESQWEKVNRL